MPPKKKADPKRAEFLAKVTKTLVTAESLAKAFAQGNSPYAAAACAMIRDLCSALLMYHDERDQEGS